MKPGPDVDVPLDHRLAPARRGRTNTTDGVVPYRSSHLDGVESEVIVQSDHGVQNEPEAIIEVQRILLEARRDRPRQAAAAAPRAAARRSDRGRLVAGWTVPARRGGYDAGVDPDTERTRR